ncbi:MAG: MFS transporter [Egibacteraceae bacterium]
MENRLFRWLCVSQFAANVADGMSPVILSLLTLATGHRSMLGTLMAVDGVCFVGGLAMGGRLGHRGLANRNLCWAHALRAGGVVPVAVALAAHRGGTIGMLVLFAVASSGTAGASQVLSTMRISELFYDSARASANGLRAAEQNLAFGLAPLLTSAGVSDSGFPLLALWWLVAVVAMATMLGLWPSGGFAPNRRSEAARPGRPLEVIRSPFLILLLLQGALLILAARGPSKVLSLLYLNDLRAYRLLALLSGAQFASAIAGSLFASKFVHRVTMRLYLVCAMGCAAPLAGVAAQVPPLVLLATFALSGASYTAYLVAWSTTAQNMTDAAGLGAVLSAQGVIWWAADPLGLFIVG